MAKIVSRPQAEEASLQPALERLTEILGKHTNGAIGTGAGAIAAPKNFEEAASAVDLALTLALRAITDLRMEIMLVDADRVMIADRLDKTLDILDKFVDVGFDDSLDKATDEMFQTVEAAGFGETDADGYLSFYPGTRFSRGDLKPFLQTIIEAWVEQKIKNIP